MSLLHQHFHLLHWLAIEQMVFQKMSCSSQNIAFKSADLYLRSLFITQTSKYWTPLTKSYCASNHRRSNKFWKSLHSFARFVNYIMSIRTILKAQLFQRDYLPKPHDVWLLWFIGFSPGFSGKVWLWLLFHLKRPSVDAVCINSISILNSLTASV